MCLISWERTQKEHPHKLFRGEFGGQKGVPNGPFWATKSLVYCFFPALTLGVALQLFSEVLTHSETLNGPQTFWEGGGCKASRLKGVPARGFLEV